MKLNLLLYLDASPQRFQRAPLRAAPDIGMPAGYARKINANYLQAMEQQKLLEHQQSTTTTSTSNSLEAPPGNGLEALHEVSDEATQVPEGAVNAETKV